MLDTKTYESSVVEGHYCLYSPSVKFVKENKEVHTLSSSGALPLFNTGTLRPLSLCFINLLSAEIFKNNVVLSKDQLVPIDKIHDRDYLSSNNFRLDKNSFTGQWTLNSDFRQNSSFGMQDITFSPAHLSLHKFLKNLNTVSEVGVPFSVLVRAEDVKHLPAFRSFEDVERYDVLTGEIISFVDVSSVFFVPICMFERFERLSKETYNDFLSDLNDIDTTFPNVDIYLSCETNDEGTPPSDRKWYTANSCRDHKTFITRELAIVERFEEFIDEKLGVLS